MQHPPTAQTHIILSEDKSISVKCVSIRPRRSPGILRLARARGRARPGILHAHHKNTEAASQTSTDILVVSWISDLTKVVRRRRRRS